MIMSISFDYTQCMSIYHSNDEENMAHVYDIKIIHKVKSHNTNTPYLVIKGWYSKKTMKKTRLSGHSEPSKMDDMWLKNNFILGSNSLVNHGGSLNCFIYYLPTR